MTKTKGIVLNRMYVGDYLSSNLGHEVINLYQADNGWYYLYLNSTGDFVKTHTCKMGYMLFVKYYCKDVIEVIGMATDLTDVYKPSLASSNKYAENKRLQQDQKDFVAKEPNGVCYGGVSIFDIFSGAEQQNVFITYKTKHVYTPKKGVRLFIRFRTEQSDENNMLLPHSSCLIELEGYQQAKASLKQYIYPEGTYTGDLTSKHIEAKQRDYLQILNQIILKEQYWESKPRKVTKKNLQEVNRRRVSLFDICQIQNSENDFSNALAYFMTQKNYRELWCNFFAHRQGQKVCLSAEDFTVTREESSKIEVPHNKTNNTSRAENGGRIDLLIRDHHSLVIIENKIKSDINSVEGDNPNLQLGRYWDYAQWLTTKKDGKDKGKRIVAYILTPNYNIPTIPKDMKDKYDIVTYKEIYDFLESHKSIFEDDINFVFFFEAMQRHTYENVNDYLYHEMNEKFLKRIKSTNINF